MARSEDLGDYYLVDPEIRGLNYEKYFEKGEEIISRNEDYASENTRRLSVKELADMLIKLDYVQQELAGANIQS
jgi:UDP-N-acetylglucosamine 4,6-dehydratase/5-epimerase